MAAVLGHEIGHVTARHAVRQISGTRAAQIGYTIGSVFVPELRSQLGQGLFGVLGGAITSGYGREHELEADHLGAEYLARSGYDPQAMLRVLEVLKDQELYERQLAAEEGRAPKIYHGVFASHPSSDQRLQEVVGSAGLPEIRESGHREEDFLQFIDGMVYGDGEQAGVIRDGVFYHADLGIAFNPPADWSSKNLPEQLLLLSPDRKAVLQLTVEDRKPRTSPRDFLRAKVKLKVLRQGEELRPAGLDGYTAWVEVGTAAARRYERISVVYQADRAFVFTGTGKDTDGFERHEAEFLATARSFHPLSDPEQGLARAFRIRLVAAKEDTSITDLARDSPLATHAEEQLRLLNRLYPDSEPTPGERLKTIE